VIQPPIPLPPPPPYPQETAAPVYAGFWIRVLAKIIDGIVLAPLALPAIIHVWTPIWRAADEASRTGQPFQAPDIAPVAYGWTLLSLAVGYLYALIMIGMWGATVGKFATGIRVRKVDGTIATWREAALRPVLPTVLDLPRASGLGLLKLVDYLWMLWDARKQTLHDKIAGTIVVRK
jgi:uncharacterized RDD family membrane protein YckC